MKLIKIKEEHYVVVDDSEIKEGDLVTNGNYITQAVNEWWTKFYNDGNKKDFWKITHSTQPLEYDEDNTYTYDKVKYIPPSYIKELIGEVDVEKKAFEYTSASQAHRRGFIDGYNQALEDNKDKKYTEEDMFRMLCLGNKLEKTNFDDENFSVFFNMFKKHIQSLQPKTEWEVEIVDGKLKLK